MGFAKTLVLKRILPHLAEDKQFVEMFLGEAKLAAQLNHPNVVQIFELGELSGSYFIVMEYIDGESLAALNHKSLSGEGRLPDDLIWHKWQSYWTWISGFALLVWVYYGQSSFFLIDPAVLPLSAWSVYAFAIALGLLWLSTVPPTNGIVAQIFGVRFLAMLSGFTFFSHQIGSFLGAWLGGLLYDSTGSYDIVWYLAIALGVVAGLINLPIDEKEIRRPVAAAA